MSNDDKAHGKAEVQPETLFDHNFKRYFWQIWSLIRGGPDMVVLESATIRRQDHSWLIILRGTHPVGMRSVVAFGSGEVLYVAVRNLNTALQKGQWRDDKYAKKG